MSSTPENVKLRRILDRKRLLLVRRRLLLDYNDSNREVEEIQDDVIPVLSSTDNQLKPAHINENQFTSITQDQSQIQSDLNNVKDKEQNYEASQNDLQANVQILEWNERVTEDEISVCIPQNGVQLITREEGDNQNILGLEEQKEEEITSQQGNLDTQHLWNVPSTSNLEEQETPAKDEATQNVLQANFVQDVEWNESVTEEEIGVYVPENNVQLIGGKEGEIQNILGLEGQKIGEITIQQSNLDIQDLWSVPSTSNLEEQQETVANKTNRTSKKRKQFNKSYLDYFVDEEEDEDDVLLKEAFGDLSDSEWSDVEVTKSKSKRINKRKERKLLKHKGEKYITKNGKEKRERHLQINPCTSSNCGNKCGVITEEKRQSIFNYFQSLTLQERRNWIANNAVITNVKRRRVNDSEPKRGKTVKYFINEGESRRQVCRQFLVATLDVSRKFIAYTVENSDEGIAKQEGRGKHVPANKTSPQAIEYVKKYISSLPALPSHYCRKETTRTYLPQDFKNPSHLYRLYKRYLLEVDKQDLSLLVSESIFKKIFVNDFNISFHVPKKDKCAMCTKYENNRDEEAKNCEEKIAHDQEKEATSKRFLFHQEIANKNTLCASFDLQKVLNTPHGESMLLYYSRKYAYYNLTVYESRTRNGMAYIWGECDGKRGSKEIGSCLFHYIDSVDKRQIKNLILYCDNCPGQNKNKTILAILNYALKRSTFLETIQINYLLAGHTYMPVDSCHSVIEKEVRNMIVWAPSQWATLIESARKKPRPYTVTVMENFQDWDPITNKTFSKCKKNINLSKIRIATFKKTKTDEMTVKYTMSVDSENTQIKLVCPDMKKKIAALYKEPLPISKAKYMDLKKLCDSGVIPRRYHEEYLKMPYETGKRDELIETDEEDEEENTHS